MEKEQSNQIHPWREMWIHPRKTLRQILDSNPFRVILWLAFFSGVISALAWITMVWAQYPQREIFRHILFTSSVMIFGGLLSVVMLYFGGWLYRLTGSWIGGKGSFTDVKCALGWANYPFIFSGILATLSYFAVPHFWWMAVIGLAQITAFVWAIIILLNLIAEAHQFTLFRAFCTLLIGLSLIFVALLIIAILVTLFSPLFSK